jgi:hypothetical protein
MAKIANVELSNTFDTWRIRSNQAFNRLSQFTIDESKLYANTVTANVRFVSLGATKLGSSAATTTIVNGILSANGRATIASNLAVTGNTSTNKLTVTSSLTSSGNTTLGAAAKTISATGLVSVTGRQTIDNNLTVSGNTTLGGAAKTISATGLVSVTGQQTIDNNLTVSGNTTLGGAAKVLTTTGLISHTGRQTISTNLTVSGNTSIAGLLANSSLGTAGFVLKTNGTSVYWDAAAAAGGAGGGDFNTAIANAVGFAPTTTLRNAFVAAATSGKRYVIRSIHVSNITTANATITGQFDGTTYANNSYSFTVPVPVGSAVELLKRPKVLQPSDKIKMQASADSSLHATIAFEVITGTSHFGAGVDVTSDATFTDLYTATGAAVVESVLLSNDDGTYDVKARVVWTDGSNNIQGYYCYDLIVPADSTVEVLDAPKHIPSGYKVRVYANVGNRLEAMIAGKVA